MKDIPVKDVTPQPVGATPTVGKKIYVRAITGFFQKLRRFSLWGFFALYFGTVWLEWGDRPAVWWDIPGRELHVFAATFLPQDFFLLAFVLIVSAFGLFTITNIAGRVWCGYTCPQTAWTLLFIWVEEKIEGSRNQRIKLDKQPLTFSKAQKKCVKHFIWLLIGLVTGITFVGYFYPIRELIPDLLALDADTAAYVWVGFFTLATYGNAGWLRESVCTFMCPYARFQAVMFDQDTLIVSYDEARGERGTGRGPRKKGIDPKEANIGDCIDCNLCVQVCPVGIDIRHGLQYQCIGCALCVDACDSIMDKMEYPRGLIRYTTEHSLEGKKTHVLRPRLVMYLGAFLAMCITLGYFLVNRSPLELDIARDRGPMYVETANGGIRNSYVVKAMNKTQEEARFRVRIEGLDNPDIRGKTEFVLRPGRLRSLPLSIQMEKEALKAANTTVLFILEKIDDPEIRAESENRFLYPKSARQ